VVSLLVANLLSMTGYGEATSRIDNLEWHCVIQSVNSRNLDVRFRFPGSLQSLEIGFRKYLQGFIARGKVDVAFSFVPFLDDDSVAASETYMNTDWVAGFCDSGEQLLCRLNWQTSDKLRAALLQGAFSQRGAFSAGEFDLQALSEPLLSLFDTALSQHHDSSISEGRLLASDIIERLSLLDSYLCGISDKAAVMPQVFKDRITERLESIIDNDQFQLDQARVTQEIAHLVDKADISEEIVRFDAHIKQVFSEINDSTAERKGKKLEFVVQEMLREINTVGSKANLLEITTSVIEVKNELEKIREQVQNIV